MKKRNNNYQFTAEQIQNIEPIEVIKENKEIEKAEESKEIVYVAITPVNVRKAPYGDIVKVLYTDEQVIGIDEIMDNVIWIKTKDGTYIMKEFLREV